MRPIESCVFPEIRDKSTGGTSLAMALEHLGAFTWHFCVQEELKFRCTSSKNVLTLC